MRKHGQRGNPWVYEKDGSLNPGWLFVAILIAVGILAVIGALLLRDGKAVIAAFSYLATMTLALLISAVPRDKAKILAESTALGAVAAGLSSGMREYGTSTENFELSP